MDGTAHTLRARQPSAAIFYHSNATVVRECYDALDESATGSPYVNFISERDGREPEAYGKNDERMLTLKNRYDPENPFRLNQNVEPTG